MTTTSNNTLTSKKTYELLSILFLLPAMYIQFIWLKEFYVSDSFSPATRTADFLGQFPDFLSSVRLIAFICLGFAIVSIYLASFSFKQPKLFWRISSFIIVMIASLIGLLCLFQMI